MSLMPPFCAVLSSWLLSKKCRCHSQIFRKHCAEFHCDRLVVCVNIFSAHCFIATRFEPSLMIWCCQWSLVCDKAGLTELSQTLIFAGQALGAVLTSSLADRYGRRKVYIVCLLGVTAGMFSISAVGNYYLSLFCRVVIGFCQTVSVILYFFNVNTH